MDEYISREELRKHLRECYDNELFDADMRKATIGIDVYVENMPAADVQPVKYGRWIIVDDVEHFIAVCSKCGRTEDSRGIKDMPYCHCGARMDGDNNA